MPDINLDSNNGITLNRLNNIEVPVENKKYVGDSSLDGAIVTLLENFKYHTKSDRTTLMHPNGKTNLAPDEWLRNYTGHMAPTSLNTNRPGQSAANGLSYNPFVRYRLISDFELTALSTIIELLEQNSLYELPIASSTTLGGIKVGNHLTINSSTGVLSVKVASKNQLGVVQAGNRINISNGVISADLSGYATETWCNNKFAPIKHTHGAGDIDLSNYYTKNESDNRFAPKSHTHDDRYYTKTQCDDRFAPKHSHNYISKLTAYNNNFHYTDLGLGKYLIIGGGGNPPGAISTDGSIYFRYF